MNDKLAKKLRSQATEETKDFPIKRVLTEMVEHGKLICLVNLPGTFRHRYRQLKKRERYARAN